MKKIVTSLGMSAMMIVVIVSGALFSGCVQKNVPVEKTVTEQQCNTCLKTLKHHK